MHRCPRGVLLIWQSISPGRRPWCKSLGRTQIRCTTRATAAAAATSISTSTSTSTTTMSSTSTRCDPCSADAASASRLAPHGAPHGALQRRGEDLQPEIDDAGLSTEAPKPFPRPPLEGVHGGLAHTKLCSGMAAAQRGAHCPLDCPGCQVGHMVIGAFVKRIVVLAEPQRRFSGMHRTADGDRHERRASRHRYVDGALLLC